MVAASHNPESRPYPGALVLADATLNWLANGELYEPAIENSEGSGTDLIPPATVRLRLRRGDLVIEKSYQFHRDNYLVDFQVSIRKDSKPVAARALLGQDIGPEREHLIDPSLQLRAIYNQGGKINRDGPPEEPNQVRRIEGDVRWVGLDMHYFCIIAIPHRPLAAFELQKKPVKTTGLDGKEIARDLLPLTIPIEDRLALKMFVGPKEQDRLNAVKDADLSEVIDFGMFSIPGPPAVVFVEMDRAVRTQLRVGDHSPDTSADAPLVSLPPQTNGFDEENGRRPAQGEGNPGEI